MPSYSNGRIPDSLLVIFKTGNNKTDGAWKHQLSPSTLLKHRALVALAKKNTGKDLKISDGWGAYRPYNIQELARKLYGMGAAVPGTSSHGGFWEGRQTLAIDYGNWGEVYGWNRDAFYRDVRAVGLEPGLIHPSRGNGYPDEPWHVVDLDPWASVPAGGKINTLKENDTMQSIQANGHLYGVDTEFITHYGNVAQAEITRKVTSVLDEEHKLRDLKQFQDLLDGLGIPRNVVDGHKGLIFNPQAKNGKGAFEKNGTWSRRREILAGQARIEAKIDALKQANKE